MQKNKALQIMAQHQGNSLVYARREEIEEISSQYEPIVTILEFQKDDFAPMGGGNFYPMKSATNRIADATGVSFTNNCGTREVGNFHTIEVNQAKDGYFTAVGNYAVVAHAQGQRLKPDGTPRLSSVCEYEFNVVDRANEDFLSDFQNKKYIRTAIDARKKLLALKKFATRRASTGAELAVIRELAGVPTALKQDQISKPMLFAQIVENNQFKLQVAKDLMKTADGRQSVAQAMFGTTQALYGPQGQGDALQRIVDSTEQQEVASLPEPDPFDDFDEPPIAAPELDERQQILQQLEEYLNADILQEKGRAVIGAALKNPDPIPTEKLYEYLEKCKAAQQRREEAV